MVQQFTVTEGSMMVSALSFVTIMMLIVLTLAKEAHPCLLFLAMLSAKLKMCKKRFQNVVQKLFVEQDDN